MSRAAILDALRADSAVTNLVPANNIFPNYASEARPNNTSGEAFLILRWDGAESAVIFENKSRGPRTLTVWAHYPEERSTDYVRLETILNAVEKTLTGLEEVVGGDGYTITSVQSTGSSGDLRDVSFRTISKNMSFKVLSRITT